MPRGILAPAEHDGSSRRVLDFLTWRRRVKIMKRPGSKPVPWSEIGGRLTPCMENENLLSNQWGNWIPATRADQREMRKVRRRTKQNTTLNQRLANSVLKPCSPEVRRIWRRENEFRSFGPVSQCRGFLPNPTVIGDFRRLSTNGEFSAAGNWRRGWV